MGGGLIQLIAYGAQDLYLTGNPEKSLFNFTYKRYTNFSKEPIEVQFENKANWGNKVTCIIPRYGDLLSQIYLRVELPELNTESLNLMNVQSKNDKSELHVRWCDFVGNALIDEVSLEIGGQIIDKQTGEFMQIMHDIADSDNTKLFMVGQKSRLQNPSNIIKSSTLYIFKFLV